MLTDELLGMDLGGGERGLGSDQRGGPATSKSGVRGEN